MSGSQSQSKSKSGLPSANELIPFAHGAAGHEGVSSNASGSLIIKPCTQAEIDFYGSARDHASFQAHMPVFMGSLSLNDDAKVQEAMGGVIGASGIQGVVSKEEKEWKPSGGKQLSTGLAIVLENAAAGFKNPCVLDLKLGARLWDDDAPEAKRQKLDQVAKETTSGSLGFRVAGMKVWLGGSPGLVQVNTDIKDGYQSYNKIYGRNLTEGNVAEAFCHVVGGKTDRGKFKRARAVELLERFLREVKSIRYVLENEESRMYSASILLILEGDDKALEAGLDDEERAKYNDELDEEDVEDEDEDEADDEELGPKVLEVRLIDFAHARWVSGEGPDENALRGVRSIQKIVEDLLEPT